MGHAHRRIDVWRPGAGDERRQFRSRIRSDDRKRVMAASAEVRKSRRRRRCSTRICLWSPAGAGRNVRSSWSSQMRAAISLWQMGRRAAKSIVWSQTGRGSYMPTPLIYKGLLYVLANNGIFDAYNLRTGEEVYRQRLPKWAMASARRRWPRTARSTCRAKTASSGDRGRLDLQAHRDQLDG